MKAMKQKKKTQETSAEPTKQSKKGKQPKQQGREVEAAPSERKKSHTKTQEDDIEKKRKQQEKEVKRKKKEEKKRREAVQQQRKNQLEQLQSSLIEQRIQQHTIEQESVSDENLECSDLNDNMDSEVEEVSPSPLSMASRHNSTPVSTPVNRSLSLTPISSANHSRVLMPLSNNCSHSRDFTPSPPPPPHPIRQASATQEEFTFTPQPSAQACKKRSRDDDGVDWKLEYRKLHKKYCMLKEKVKILEQQSTHEGEHILLFEAIYYKE